jgi:hypothetical protein
MNYLTQFSLFPYDAIIALTLLTTGLRPLGFYLVEQSDMVPISKQ